MFNQMSQTQNEFLLKIVEVLPRDQDEIFVKYETKTFEKVSQENYNQLIHDKTYELYNDLKMVYSFHMCEEYKCMTKEHLNVRI